MREVISSSVLVWWGKMGILRHLYHSSDEGFLATNYLALRTRPSAKGYYREEISSGKKLRLSLRAASDLKSEFLGNITVPRGNDSSRSALGSLETSYRRRIPLKWASFVSIPFPKSTIWLFSASSEPQCQYEMLESWGQRAGALWPQRPQWGLELLICLNLNNLCLPSPSCG